MSFNRPLQSSDNLENNHCEGHTIPDEFKLCHTFWNTTLEDFFQDILKGTKEAGTCLNMRMASKRPLDRVIAKQWRERFEDKFPENPTKKLNSQYANYYFLVAACYQIENNDEMSKSFYYKAQSSGCSYAVNIIKKGLMTHGDNKNFFPFTTTLFDFEYEHSETFFVLESNPNDPDGMLHMGSALRSSDDLITALEHYCDAAEAGQALACSRIAAFLQNEWMLYPYREYLITRYPKILEDFHDKPNIIDLFTHRNLHTKEPCVTISYNKIDSIHWNEWANAFRQLGCDRGDFYANTDLNHIGQNSLQCLMFSAELGDYRAIEIILANMLENNSVDVKKCLQLAGQAIQDGSHEVAYILGNVYRNGNAKNQMFWSTLNILLILRVYVIYYSKKIINLRVLIHAPKQQSATK